MTPSNFPLYLIPLLPLLAAAFNLIFGKRLGKNVVTLAAVGSVGGSMFVTWKAVALLHRALPTGTRLVDTFFKAPWIKAGDLDISAGLALDNLSAVLCLIITGIGLLIHIYSTSYMEHEERYTRFFGYLNLFMGAMLILVLGDSLPVTFIGWEGVGLCSYLLIGFYYEKSSFAYAGRKAFVVNRIGDFGLLLAMFLLFTHTGTLKYAELGSHLSALMTPSWFGLPPAYFIGLLILVGAMGKSAQIPLYVWLPDAMAGPTPVSALIHAATMVTAGVYVITRTHAIFEIAPSTLWAVAFVGAITALFAATIGFAQRDLKKVLAYSTISQLGFMFVGVGSYVSQSSNYDAGVLHLMTHAFFKAGLFLGAGSVMHAMSGEGDIFKMGGLRKHLPHTHATFLIYCLAITGFPLTSGFWSKDAIIGGIHAAVFPVGDRPGAIEAFFAHNTGHILYVVLLLAAACTSFYMFRLYFLVFWGTFRGTHEQEHHLHESPPSMTLVLWILAVGSLLSGFLGVPESVLPESLKEYGNLMGRWLAPVVSMQNVEESGAEFWIGAGIAVAISFASIAIAWYLYGRSADDHAHGDEHAHHTPRAVPESTEKLVASIEPLRKLVANKYYIDELYDLVIVRPIRWIAHALWKFADAFIIDGIVNLTARIIDVAGRLLKRLQNGDLQRYVVGVIAGAVLVLFVSTNWTSYAAARFEYRVDGRNVTVVANGAGPYGQQRVEYRIKWDKDGELSKPQPSPKFTRHFDMDGDKRVTIEATDTRWGSTSTHTEMVKVLP